MAGLMEKKVKEEGDGHKWIRFDPAKSLAEQHTNPQELAIQILTKMNLPQRNRRDAWYPEGHEASPEEWLRDMFIKINNCRHPEFTMPQKIEVIVPKTLLGSTDLELRIIDTKGIDRAAERKDIECHFNDPRTLVVLCSRFNDAPEVQLQNLMHRAKEGGVRDLSRKTLILVLPRPEEALAVKYDDGAEVDAEEEGYDLKRDQVLMRVDQQGLPKVAVEFYNAREESNNGIRSRILELVHAQRAAFAEQITTLAQAVNNLDANRTDEQKRLVLERVMSDLTTWTRSNTALEIAEFDVERSLIKAIDTTRYASTVRASVRRQGEWDNLNYYHHLSYGTRLLAVDRIGSRIKDFKTIVQNLIENNDLSPAHEFLKGILGRLDVAVDDAYNRLQTAGYETFKQTLERHHQFWIHCEGEWGKGKGYRERVRDRTESELKTNSDDAKNIIRKLVTEEWEKLIRLLRELLGEQPV